MKKCLINSVTCLKCQDNHIIPKKYSAYLECGCVLDQIPTRKAGMRPDPRSRFISLWGKAHQKGQVADDENCQKNKRTLK